MDQGHQEGSAEAVGYELRQMVGAALRIAAAPDDATHIALLESTLLHVRVLTEFLVGRGQSEDVKATDLAPGWTIGEDARPGLLARLDALDKHLAHLTRARVRSSVTWRYPHIVRETVGHMRGVHRTMLDTGQPFASTIGDELDRIEAEADRVWTSETIYNEVETTTSPTVMHVSTSRDPLELPSFQTGE